LRRLELLLAVGIAVAVGVAAQEAPAESETPIEIYGLGDQLFSINAGLMLPLFFRATDGTVVTSAGHLDPGAVGALRWAGFVSNGVSIGAELGGMFEPTILDRTLISISVAGFASYTLRFYPFEAVLHAGLGVNLLRLDSDLYVGPIVKPGVSLYWNFNSEWAFGVRSEYWLIPEIYSGDLPPTSHSNFGNFVAVTLSTLYHF